MTLRPLSDADAVPLFDRLGEPQVSPWWVDYTTARIREEVLDSDGVSAGRSSSPIPASPNGSHEHGLLMDLVLSDFPDVVDWRPGSGTALPDPRAACEHGQLNPFPDQSSLRST